MSKQIEKLLRCGKNVSKNWHKCESWTLSLIWWKHQVGLNSLVGERTKEVNQAILELKTGDWPGPDGWHVEFHQTSINEIKDLLAIVFNSGIEEGKLDSYLYPGVLSPIYMRWDTQERDKWRHSWL